MAVPENLLKAFVEADSEGVGSISEALAKLEEFVTDIESFTQVFVATESDKTQALLAEAYPDLYLEYAVNEGLVEPLYDCCFFDFQGPCFVVTVDGVNRLLLPFGAGVTANTALKDTRSPSSEPVEPEEFLFDVDDFEEEVSKERTDLLPEFQPVALPESVLDGVERGGRCCLWVVLDFPLSDPDEWTTELLKFRLVTVGTKRFAECLGWGHFGSEVQPFDWEKWENEDED